MLVSSKTKTFINIWKHIYPMYQVPEDGKYNLKTNN